MRISDWSSDVCSSDLLPTDAIPDVTLFQMDFMDERAPDILREALGAQPDLILSDMAANTVGHAQTDHLRTLALVEAAAWFAIENLQKGGAFVRSEERRVGKERGSTCRSRWSPSS